MITDLKPIVEKLYPENSHGGQCAVFCEKLVVMPTPGNVLGNSLAEKTDKVNRYGIRAVNGWNQFHLGDVMITNESLKYGHVAFVNWFDDKNLRLSESNFRLDERVHHTRLLSRTSPHIIGVLRGAFKFQVPNN